ncbi:MAG: glycoside hydrolase family 38 C-terminal domain-containing protein [Candidatus Njordarchaeia archaeon]
MEGIFIAKSLEGIGYTFCNLEEKLEDLDVSIDFRGQIVESEKYMYEILLGEGGAIKVLDKVDGKTLGKFNILVDDGDVGDEYNYDAPENNTMVTSRNTNAKILDIKKNGEILEITLEIEMKLPLKSTRQERSHEKIAQPIRLKYTFYRDLDRVDAEITLENRVTDHRMRVLNEIMVNTDEVHEELHFIENRRKIPKKEPIREKDAIEVNPRAHPYHDYLYLYDGTRGIMIASKGLYEHSEIRKDKHIDLYLTIFRSIGYLSRGDLESRKGHAGPGLPTPGAQCKRLLKFQYSIIPFRDKWESVKLAKNFTQPIFGVYSEGKGSLPNSYLSLKINGKDFMLTAFKKSEEGENKIVRITNLLPRENKIKIYPIRKGREVGLDEKGTISIEEMEIGEITLKPSKIHTIRFTD